MRNGHALMLHRPRGKDLADKEELTQIRHFLERSDVPEQPPAATGTHLLVVIDHREARIYSTELHGSVPQRITPYDPFGFWSRPALQPGRFQRPAKTRAEEFLRSSRQDITRREADIVVRNRHGRQQCNGAATLGSEAAPHRIGRTSCRINRRG